MSTRIEVLAPFKVSLSGQSWRPGEVAEVDDATAQRWVRYGYVTVVEVLPEPEPEPHDQEQPATHTPEPEPQDDEQPDPDPAEPDHAEYHRRPRKRPNTQQPAPED